MTTGSKIPDLMAALEDSLAAAKAAREQRKIDVIGVPNELVQAAAEALCGLACGHFSSAHRPCPSSKAKARTAIQAAFAKLPGCEVVRSLLEKELNRSCGDSDCTWFAHRPVCATETSLATLAREFGKFGGRDG